VLLSAVSMYLFYNYWTPWLLVTARPGSLRSRMGAVHPNGDSPNASFIGDDAMRLNAAALQSAQRFRVTNCSTRLLGRALTDKSGWR